MKKIFIHLPAYREPELIPTIKSALNNARYPERLVFGICRQYNPEDGFDNIDEFRSDPRFKIMDILYTDAKGLPYARYQINTMLEDEEYICQLDSHHRFAHHWDELLIEMHDQLKNKGIKKPILTGYLPYYDPFNDPARRTMEPWQQQFVCFYPHNTIFIRPGLLQDWQNREEPVTSRFLSGHFCFADNHWAKTILHDQDIYFSGEEINLTVRSYTHGYDMFHPHQLVIWHATMREERDGILVWDDQSKRGEDWWSQQEKARAKIRQLFKLEDNGFDLSGYDLGIERTLEQYEQYAGIKFKDKLVQQYTLDNEYAPTPNDSLWVKSFYHLVTIHRNDLPNDDYDSILIAFDDKDGIGVHSRSIKGEQLKNFLENKGPIHYEEYFEYLENKPARMVAWGYSNTRGWAERLEQDLNG
jgi:hypothetical protein